MVVPKTQKCMLTELYPYAMRYQSPNMSLSLSAMYFVSLSKLNRVSDLSRPLGLSCPRASIFSSRADLPSQVANLHSNLFKVICFWNHFRKKFGKFLAWVQVYPSSGKLLTLDNLNYGFELDYFFLRTSFGKRNMLEF